MSWRERLAPASFRGVQFHVETNEFASGRRTARHEYPKRDRPFIEDMGRATREITFDAYVIGSEYLVDKNALIDALEKAGPGELVHPLYGRRTVQAGGFSVRETRTEGGMARFALSFSETGDSRFPAAVEDANDAVVSAAETADDTAEGSFLERFSVAGLPQWAVDKARDTVAQMGDTLSDVLAPIRSAGEAASTLNQDIIRLQDEAEDLVRQPERLANVMRTIMGSVVASDVDARTRSRSLRAFYDGFAPEPEPTTTETRQAVERNRDALDGFAHQITSSAEASVAIEREYPTLDDAEQVRDGIADHLDEQAEHAPDTVFDALTALRARLVRAIPPENSNLPRLVTIREHQTVPAVVLAYRLYEDADRGAEIVSRNRVRHPSFVPGGVDLEVLSSE